MRSLVAEIIRRTEHENDFKSNGGAKKRNVPQPLSDHLNGHIVKAVRIARSMMVPAVVLTANAPHGVAQWVSVGVKASADRRGWCVQRE